MESRLHNSTNFACVNTQCADIRHNYLYLTENGKGNEKKITKRKEIVKIKSANIIIAYSFLPQQIIVALIDYIIILILFLEFEIEEDKQQQNEIHAGKGIGRYSSGPSR